MTRFLASWLFGAGLWLPLADPVLAAGAGAAPASTAGGAPAASSAAGHGASKAAAPAPARGAAAAPAPPSPQEPLEVIRDRLAARLGATGLPRPGGAESRHVVQVSSAASGEFRVTPGRATAARAAARDRSPRGVDGARDGGDRPVRDAHGRQARDEHGHGGHWSYDGQTGPAHWARLDAGFELCAKGRRQSPIDIRDGFAVDLEPVAFAYRPGSFSVIDNGHTLQVSFAPGNQIQLGDRSFELLQMHFHHPAEEWVDGRRADMSAHLVHRDADGRLAVVALQLQRGAAQPLIQQVWNNLPLESGVPVQARGTLDPLELLPADRRYFTYMGSLTTPPCTEGVQWIVLKQPVELSDAQVRFFARLYPMNARPVQSAAGRVIKQSN